MTRFSLHIFLFFCLFLLSCSGEDNEIDDRGKMSDMEEEEEATGSEEGLSFLALGDSYTIGTGISEDKAWPIQLKEDLLERDIAVSEVSIIAQAGWSTSDLISALETQNVSEHDLVSLMIGVNNQFRKIDFSVFKTEFVLLLEAALDYSGTSEKVFVLSIPDYSVTLSNNSNNSLIADEIDEYNAFIEEQCSEREIVYINVTQISRDLGSSASALASDGLHPSETQYAKWIEIIGPTVEDLIKD